MMQDMCEDSGAQVGCAAGASDAFNVTVGVHRGSVLGPLLFAVIMDCLTGHVGREAPWDMMFADDVVLNADTRGRQRRDWWRGGLEGGGVKVSRKKTEYSVHWRG